MLTDDLNINDGIRFIDDDIGFTVTSLFKDKKRVEHAKKGDVVSIYCKDKISNSKVVKTTDYLLNKKIEDILKNKKKIDIFGTLEAVLDKPLRLKITDGNNEVVVTGNIVQKSITSPISHERIIEQLNKTGNTIYQFKELKIDGDTNIFIPIKELNDLRNKAINLLDEKRLYKYEYIKENYAIETPDFKKEKNYNVLISNMNQYNKIKNNNYKYIYMEQDLFNKIKDERKVLRLNRVLEHHQKYNQKLLVGELGSLIYEDILTDFSFNVTNSYSVALLHSLNVKQVCLSYELTDTQIKNLIDSYHDRYNKHPNLELVIYGNLEAMISKYNINEKYNIDKSILLDRFNNKYKIIIKDNLMHIYDYKKRNYKDINKYFDMGINNLRYNLEVEDE